MSPRKGETKTNPNRKPAKTGGRQVSFWASEAEIEKYDAKAARAGISRSMWLRKSANRAK